MTAEIVDLQKYREQKKRAAGEPQRSRRSYSRAPTRKFKKETGTNGPEEALSDDRLDNDDGTRGGEPV
jgi:hypothetical protein